MSPDNELACEEGCASASSFGMAERRGFLMRSVAGTEYGARGGRLAIDDDRLVQWPR